VDRADDHFNVSVMRRVQVVKTISESASPERRRDKVCPSTVVEKSDDILVVSLNITDKTASKEAMYVGLPGD